MLAPSGGKINAGAFSHERLFPLRGPQASRALAIIASELVGHPEERAVDHGAIVAGQVHDPGLDDETAEFDQMPGALPAFDLPIAHVTPRPRCLMAVELRPVVFERRQGHAQMSE